MERQFQRRDRKRDALPATLIAGAGIISAAAAAVRVVSAIRRDAEPGRGRRRSMESAEIVNVPPHIKTIQLLRQTLQNSAV